MEYGSGRHFLIPEMDLGGVYFYFLLPFFWLFGGVLLILLLARMWILGRARGGFWILDIGCGDEERDGWMGGWREGGREGGWG